jgi:hypothetical protein
VEANSTGGQGSRRAVAPSDDDDDDTCTLHVSAHAKAAIIRYINTDIGDDP